jgi:glc operon protein GlcG
VVIGIILPYSHLMQDLSHRDAQRVLSVVQADLERTGGGAAVAVVDHHGELVALVRTDGCPLPSINNAINKAYTAARERKPSRHIGDAARQEQFPITNFGDLRYTGWGGGVPLVVGDDVIGAVGVSGLPEDDDIALAELGAAALR